ncbi:hypothetical protein ALP8811_00617 [Aliiroseovarius pelagivivens]|uniref:DUF6314 domain-containing protein n=1 Tax=Aliiroseovarius pelagivivens TaxID=1639690 RepID=A0A2R8AID1_9RHOB|nr:DUF6314 family protein [Aliiroseovarius pelagivivens]SPF75624.1 hypothetical protein ALP8811_00617 [Aliiroseovarius pelagivivens]
MRLADFLGEWQIEREVAEETGAVHRLSGAAVFSAEPGGLLYREEGQLVTENGASFAASRVYHWCGLGDGRVKVLFADGRDFHMIDLTVAQPEDLHWCDPDQYRVSFDFSLWPTWQSVWNVSGPRKGYRMVTRYRR